MAVPNAPKVYHIIHVDRLAANTRDGLFSDAAIRQALALGTVIGMSSIKGWLEAA
jgi:hypothetical protein